MEEKMKSIFHAHQKNKWLLLVVMLITFGSLNAWSAALGDVNASGVVDIVDALLVAQYYVGLSPANFDSTVSDVNASGSTDIVDALLIAQFYVGLITQFPGAATSAPTTAPTAAPTVGPTAVPTAVPTQGPTAAPATGFVQRVGNRLALNGKTFFYNGSNQYYLFYKSHLMVDDVLNDAAALKLTVMRTWGFCDGVYQGAYCFQPSPGVYDEPTFQNMDYTISKASSLGIKLIIPLVNNWNDMGGMNQYVSWAGASAHDDFYTNSTCKTTYKNYISHFLNRVNSITGIIYKNDPTIMMWELGNEPRCTSDTSGAKLQAWIDEMAAYIKSIDTNHLLGTGEEGFDLSWGQGTDFINNNSGANIDICSAHLYPNSWNLTLDQATAYIQQHATSAHNTLGKPFYLGEYGWNIASGGIASRDTAYTAWYNMLDSTNSDGANFWILSGIQDDGTYYQDYDGFTTYYPADTSTCALISAFSTKQAAKSGITLDTTAPTVSISSPSNGGTVSGTVTVSGTATDNMGLSKVEVALNGGIWRVATGTSSWSYSWDSTAWINGTNTIIAKATDTQNNSSTSQITVTVNNGAVTSTSYEISASKSQDDGYWFIYIIHLTNKTSASLTGDYKIRFFLAPEGTITMQGFYDNSTTYNSTVTASAIATYGGGQSYFDVDLGTRTFAPGAYIGYQGDIGLSGAGFISSNDWSSSQITTTMSDITHVAVYKDGVIVAGFQP
jgi:mannan endo-1,4-beta-mannosidase